MELITKLEKIILGWVKNVPHLPAAGQKWLGLNMWWIVLVSAIIGGLVSLYLLNSLFTVISLLDAVSSTYYVTGAYTATAVLHSVISLVLVAAVTALLALSVKPLKDRQKKGWVLLFLTWVVFVATVVIDAVVSSSISGFIVALLFGAIFAAISGYFIFEAHSQFAHPAKKAKKE